jgi:hypothetical protein
MIKHLLAAILLGVALIAVVADIAPEPPRDPVTFSNPPRCC